MAASGAQHSAGAGDPTLEIHAQVCPQHAAEEVAGSAMPGASWATWPVITAIVI